MIGILLMLVYAFGAPALARILPYEYMEIALFLFQVLIYTTIAFAQYRMTDYKQLKEVMKEDLNNPISKRKTHVKISEWVTLFLIYFNMELISPALSTPLYYCSQFMTFALTFLLMYPLLAESNYNFKIKGIGLVIATAVGGYFLSRAFDYVYTLILYLLNVLPEVDSVNQQAVVASVIADPIREFLSVCISAAIMEEWLFRGLGFRTLLHRNRFLAYSFTFLLFGFVHLTLGFLSGAGWSELIFLPLYGMSGIIMAAAYEITGTIYTSMLLHFINNMISYISILGI